VQPNQFSDAGVSEPLGGPFWILPQALVARHESCPLTPRGGTRKMASQETRFSQFHRRDLHKVDALPMTMAGRSSSRLSILLGRWRADRMQSLRDLAIALAALAIGAWSAVTAYKTWFDERNARLVEIGVSILKVDPQKEPQITAARDWALDLIDGNAGGVRFSREAREQLRKERLPVGDVSYPIDYGWGR
jgi:hypothetical protein